MTVGKKVLKGSLLLSAGQLVGYGSSFLRNVLLARVLTKTDFGIAASLALTMAAFEVAGRLSIAQQVVQSKDGDNENFLATAHLCQFIAGCGGAILIAAFGGPMAQLFDVPQARWAFMTVGLLSVFSGLLHLDFLRSMRTLSFKKRVTFDLVPELLLTTIAFPVVLWLRDYRACVVLLFSKSLLSMGMSHLLAEQPYRWKLDPHYLRSILTFGWPLLINALLMFGYQQGDQLLIGGHYSVASLAPYSLAVSITMVPGYMFQYVLNTVMLPLLSQASDDEDAYRRRFRICSELSVFAGVLITCFLILCGEKVIVLVYGAKYGGTGAFVAWLAVANTLRIVRSVTSIAAIARGDTINNMLSNIFRASSLGLATLAVIYNKPIIWIATCGTVGEVMALGASWLRLAKHCRIPLSIGLRPTAIGMFFVAVAGAVLVWILPERSWLALVGSTLAICGSAGIVMWRTFGESREYVLGTLRSVNLPGPVKHLLAGYLGATRH